MQRNAIRVHVLLAYKYSKSPVVKVCTIEITQFLLGRLTHQRRDTK